MKPTLKSFQKRSQASSLEMTVNPLEYIRNKSHQDTQLIRINTNSTSQKEPFLQRLNLVIKNIPEIKAYKWTPNCIELQIKTYEHSFSNHILTLNSNQTVQCLYQISKTYELLTQKYGLFQMTYEQIRFDKNGTMAIWINSQFYKNVPSYPLPLESESQSQAVNNFVDLIRECSGSKLLKYIKVLTFKQLVLFFEKVNKRSQIHKKCQRIVQNQNIQKKRATMISADYQQNHQKNTMKQFPSQIMHSPRLSQKPRFSINFSNIASSQADSGLGTSAMLKKQSSYFSLCSPKLEKKSSILRQRNMQNLSKNLPKLSISTTHNKMSYVAETDKKTQSQAITESSIKRKESKNSLEENLNNLFLSEISEDSESQQEQKLKNFFQDFTNVFY